MRKPTRLIANGCRSALKVRACSANGDSHGEYCVRDLQPCELSKLLYFSEQSSFQRGITLVKAARPYADAEAEGVCATGWPFVPFTHCEPDISAN